MSQPLLPAISSASSSPSSLSSSSLSSSSSSAPIGGSASVPISGSDVPASATVPMVPVRLNWLASKRVIWDRVHGYLAASLSRNHLSNGGPCVKALELHLLSLLEIDPTNKTVILINNGSSAIHAVVSALELQSGRKQRVVTQSFTFPASAQASCEGARIVDVDAEGGVDLALVKPEEMDVLIVTNCFGHLTNVRKYEEWATKYNKTLIFDNAATSFSHVVESDSSTTSSKTGKKNSLNFGTAATISFHHTKPCGFGEGGAIIVDRSLEPFIRMVMNFGYDVPRGNVVWQASGNNYKMADTAAAFIYAYLDDLPSIIQAHRRVYDNAKVMIEAMELQPPVTFFPNYNSVDTPFASCIPLLFARPISEALVVQMAATHAMDLRKYYKPLDPTQPVSADLYARIVCFPCQADMNEQHIQRIKEVIRNIHNTIQQ